MIDWEILTQKQLIDYIDSNLSLPEQAERVYDIDNIIIPTYVEVLLLSSSYSLSEVSWSNLTIDQLGNFIRLNITLQDQAKDIFYNRLGNKELTPSVVSLIDRRIAYIETNFTDLVYDTIKVISSYLSYKDIINLCESGVILRDMCSDKLFWIYYTKEVYDIKLPFNTTIEDISEGIQLTEISNKQMISVDRYSRKYDPFILWLNLTEKNINFEHLSHLHTLHLDRNDKSLDLSPLINLNTLYTGTDNSEINIGTLINLRILVLEGNRGKSIF